MSAPGDERISVLVVDDDTELCELLGEFLGRRQIAVEAVHDGRIGLTRALSGDHDLVLADVMMPGLDGFELVRLLRRQSEIPVIMLTARTGQVDRVAGLDAGADDYLPKPFGPEELVARVRAVLRRTRRVSVSQVIEAEAVRLIPSARTVMCAGVEVPVTSIEYDILEHLVRAAGRVVSRDEMSTALWRRKASPFDRALDVHVSHLRKKLGPHARLIRTVRGVGFLFSSGAPSEAAS